MGKKRERRMSADTDKHSHMRGKIENNMKQTKFQIKYRIKTKKTATTTAATALTATSFKIK